MEFYFAGGVNEYVFDVIKKNNLNTLRSFVESKKEFARLFECKRNGWKGKLLVDSGAFTVHRSNKTINIDEYIAWLNENDEYIDYFIELDHIPGRWGQPRTYEMYEEGAIKSWENYEYMYSRLKSPDKLLPVFHQGERFEHFIRIVKDPRVKYMCISGAKDLTSAVRIKWYKECYKYIKQYKPDLKVHCLGNSKVEDANILPFESMDASSYIKTAVTGSIFNYDGTSINVGQKLDDVYMIDNINKLCEDYRDYIDVDFDKLHNCGYDRIRFNIINTLKRCEKVYNKDIRIKEKKKLI